MREVALEVHLVFLSVVGMVEERVGVVEDVPLGDGVVVVVFAEGVKCPIGDVLFAVGAFLVVGVEWWKSLF